MTVPALLAASALGRLTLSGRLALLARRTLREDWRFVADALPHFLKLYS